MVIDVKSDIEQISSLKSYLFDTDSTVEDPWYFREYFVEKKYDQSLIVKCAIEVFLELGVLNEEYSTIQIVNGIRYLIDSSASDFSYSYFSKEVDAGLRKKVIMSMGNLFSNYFEEQCPLVLASDKKKKRSALSSLCYMWWDVLPRHGVPYQEHNKEIDEAILNVLQNILRQSNIACKESAIHGLGHWCSGYPDEVSLVINRNLQFIPLELRDYSELARIGRIQ